MAEGLEGPGARHARGERVAGALVAIAKENRICDGVPEEPDEDPVLASAGKFAVHGAGASSTGLPSGSGGSLILSAGYPPDGLR